jgi:hypothetical protein
MGNVAKNKVLQGLRNGRKRLGSLLVAGIAAMGMMLVTATAQAQLAPSPAPYPADRILPASGILSPVQPVQPREKYDFDGSDIPAPLKPWEAWVLAGAEKPRPNPCPFLYNSTTEFACVWPGKLRLNLRNDGGEFDYQVTVYDRARVNLPGREVGWPVQVRAASASGGVTEVAVAAGENGPNVLLAPGTYRLTGEFRWPRLPETLSLPQEVALVDVTLEGKPLSFPEIEAGGQLRLRQAVVAKTPQAKVEDRLEVRVYRKLSDTIPTRIETRLSLDVAGNRRETLLGKVLLEGALPMDIQSSLPARIEPDGSLRLQVTPGRHSVTLFSRLTETPKSLSLPSGRNQLPESEIWAFEAAPNLRTVEIEGAMPLDANQTELPQEWKHLPVYLVKPDSAFKLVEKKRGDSTPMPDDVSLRRSLWLDFDGHGFTVQDAMSGTIRASSRLNSTKELTLGRVSIDGANQFITTLPGAPEQEEGVEVRPGNLNLQADGRLDSEGFSLSALGWQTDVQSLSTTLNLPPGWLLLYASGVDKLSYSWLTDWTLLDIFMVLLAVLAIYRLYGPLPSLLAAAALTLVHPLAEWVTSLTLLLLIFAALAKLLPNNRFARMCHFLRRGISVAFILALLPFMVLHLRHAIYPQLAGVSSVGFEEGFGGNADMAVSSAAPGVAMDMAMPAPAPTQEMMMPRRYKSESMIGRAYGDKEMAVSQQSQNQLYAYDPNNKVQTGFGVTNWEGQTIYLNWNGPVSAGHRFQLYLLPPFVNVILALLRVALLVVLVAILASSVFRRSPEEEGQGGFPTRDTSKVTLASLLAAWLVAGGLMMVAAPSAIAQTNASSAVVTPYPPTEVLNQLKSKLLHREPEIRECSGACADLSRLWLEAEGNRLTLRLEVHMQARGYLPLPGNTDRWKIESVTVGGEEGSSATLRRAGQGSSQAGGLQILLSEGVQRVTMTGLVRNFETINLDLPLPPRSLETRLNGWEVQGIGSEGQAGDNLQLVPSATAVPVEKTSSAANTKSGEEESGYERQSLPPFLNVSRALYFGTSWTASTTVSRVTPARDPVVVEVPLLKGEVVTTPGIRVREGKAIVNLGTGETSLSWESVLSPVSRLELAAAETTQWVEQWQVDVSNLWHVEFKGIPPVHGSAGIATRSFQPWPGERLQLNVSQPKGVSGQTVTLESSRLELNPGKRLINATFSAEITSSMGGQHEVALPKDATLKEVMRGGESLPLELKEGKLVLPLKPGRQQLFIRWTQELPLGSRFEGPSVSLGIPGVNATVSVAMPNDRWILFVSGPDLGPAILFWSWIPLVLIAAFVLAKLDYTPLSFTAWFLLLMGLSQAGLDVNILIVLWLLAFGWRERRVDEAGRWWTHNLRQIALAVLTFISLIVLMEGVRNGLLGSPDMRITGNGSSNYYLNWYQDRISGLLPRPTVISLPVMVYRVIMLIWALWLAFSLLRWLKWQWQAFNTGGLWRSRPLPTLPLATSAASAASSSEAKRQEDIRSAFLGEKTEKPDASSSSSVAEKPRKPEKKDDKKE